MFQLFSRAEDSLQICYLMTYLKKWRKKEWELQEWTVLSTVKKTLGEFSHQRKVAAAIKDRSSVQILQVSLSIIKLNLGMLANKKRRLLKILMKVLFTIWKTFQLFQEIPIWASCIVNLKFTKFNKKKAVRMRNIQTGLTLHCACRLQWELEGLREWRKVRHLAWIEPNFLWIIWP